MIKYKKSTYIKFLNELQQSGVTNMWGAGPYLAKVYPKLSSNQVMEILKDWMRNWESYQTKELSGKPKSPPSEMTAANL